VTRITEPADGRAYPATWVNTEGIMSTETKEIVSSIVVWLAIIAIFAIL